MKIKKSLLRKIIKEIALKASRENLNEGGIEQLKMPSDVSYYERDWQAAFKTWSSRYYMDFGPRESDMYDWNDRSHYESVKKEFNAHMSKVAAKLNAASKGLESADQVWNKILTKYRKKDRG